MPKSSAIKVKNAATSSLPAVTGPSAQPPIIALFTEIHGDDVNQFIENNTKIAFGAGHRYYLTMKMLSDLVRQAHPQATDEQIAARVDVLRDQLFASLEPASGDGLALPQRARITYARRDEDSALAGTNIIEFLRAEYGPWLDGTLTRAAFRKIDPSGEMALRNWLRKNTLPKDLVIPTRPGVDEVAVRDPVRILEAMRLSSAAARRRRATLG